MEGLSEVPNMYAYNKLEYKHRYISLYRSVPRQYLEYCYLAWETHSINVIILTCTTTVYWHEWFRTVKIKRNMQVEFRSNHNAFTFGKLYMTQHTEKSHERLQIWLGVPMFLCSVHQERLNIKLTICAVDPSPLRSTNALIRPIRVVACSTVSTWGAWIAFIDI